MKKINRILNFIALGGLLCFAGCEEQDKPKKQDPANRNQGRENFKSYAGGRLTQRGQYSERIVDVFPNTEYEIILECTNDGDKDWVSISVDNQYKGTYITQERRYGGNGWYSPQYAGPYSAISTGDTMKLEAKVLHTDKYGVWPKEWTVSKKQ